MAPTQEATPSDELGSAASLLRGLADAPGLRAARLRAGTVIAGKYEIVAELGHGGMGVVYRARDRQLGRDVAIKLGAAMSATALARMAREAQALARLSHPNVVGVFEVGELDGRVFVAMEHVAGGTLAGWLAKPRRTVREILAMGCAAGDGLAAAHAAGIVHRDIKPGNVLVGDDGRPRIADFGLAREASDRDDLRDDSAEPLEDVTHAGAIVGTPAYMAPEQLAGAEVDARADQFSLCVMLWEALYGVRPFTSTAAEPRRAVPRHVVAALNRGLASDPQARWPSVEALLAELRRDPARGMRIAWITGSVVLAVCAAIAFPMMFSRHEAPCDDGTAALAPVWSPATASRLAPEVRQRFQNFANAWMTAHTATCVATRVNGGQSEAMMERRNICLASMRAELSSALEKGTPSAAAALPDLGECNDVATLAKQPEIPPGAGGAIERVFADIAAVRVSAGAPDPKAAGDRVLAAARATTWPPLIAHAARIRAELIDDDAALEEAARLALSAGADRDAAWAMAELAHRLAMADKRELSRSWLALARSLWERTSHDPDLYQELVATAAILSRDH
jgi:tRNA A-37 threonylcarbamoyl transferase component Bud32